MIKTAKENVRKAAYIAEFLNNFSNLTHFTVEEILKRCGDEKELLLWYCRLRRKNLCCARCSEKMETEEERLG